MNNKIIVILFSLVYFPLQAQVNNMEAETDSMMKIAKQLETEYIPNENLVYNHGKFDSKTSKKDLIELFNPRIENCIGYDEDEKFEYDCFFIGNNGTKILNTTANVETIKDTLITFDKYPKLRVGLPLIGMNEYFPLNYNYLISSYINWSLEKRTKNRKQIYVIACESTKGSYPNHMTLLSLLIEFDLITMNITGFEFIEGYE